ncbi:cytoplasmic polyadenylation element-binding protein 2-like [Stylophora pistillata]|uniref:Cytoplasmic polyadenylation element-binding protein 2 n=1 Tax=Stylophora pistillata TaxID=50429 RepID=A0A2B4RHW8_STYPI|nr:cytoplasmic polyadenylation element-binding protein 2-like [Stylophora pistillata]PFX16393.1 Cytoplasmic polyadenylation element-binding protein 2 [Stylophora pistillata]
MADFGHTTRSLSPVDYNHSDSRAASLFFPGNLKEEHSDNKNIKNGSCEDCLDDSPKSKVISTQGNTPLEQTKQLNFTRDSENSMFHDFATSTTFWSPATVEDVFVPGAIPQPVNGIHLPSNTPVITQPRRVNGPTNMTTTMNHQPRRPIPHNSAFITQNKSMPTVTSLGGWNQQTPPSISGWPSQQQNSWGSRPSNHTLNAINFPHGRNSRPSSLTLPSSSRMRNHHRLNPTFPPVSRSTISTQSITQGLQSLSLNRQPVDGTILDDIPSLGNSHGQNNELSNSLYSYQDSMKFPSLETRLLDIIRSPSDPPDNLSAFKYHLQKRGTSHAGDQIVPSIWSLNCSPTSDLPDHIERYSRKVFVGGLPPDIDEDEIHASFCRFGSLTVDWPHKAESKSYFPPKGYAFLLYLEEQSVQKLIDACFQQDDKLYLCVSSPTIKDKPVQIRPWNLNDSDFVMDGSHPLDPRKTIFVGGVPRPLRAIELAMIMDRLYGGVCYAGIDVDPELKYPKGAGRVAFSNQQSYIAAISARFVQLQHGDIDKRVEVKPYVLDDQLCDECHGARCAGKFAPFFCANVTCLQYYCEQCWAIIHSRQGREFHKPLVKEGADRPRTVPFRW